MRKKLNLYLHSYVPQDVIHDIDNDLGEILQGIGINMSFHEDINGEKSIIFDYDISDIREKLGRGAGAKPKNLNDITAQDVRDRMASGETAEQIAKSLVITISTLFRRLKNAETIQTLGEEVNIKTDGKL